MSADCYSLCHPCLYFQFIFVCGFAVCLFHQFSCLVCIHVLLCLFGLSSLVCVFSFYHLSHFSEQVSPTVHAMYFYPICRRNYHLVYLMKMNSRVLYVININVPQRINYDDHIVHQLNATTEELRYEFDPNYLISQHISSKYYTQNSSNYFHQKI